MKKQPREIEYIRRACAITDRCFSRIVPWITPGVTEQEIADRIVSFIKNEKAELAFPPIVAFGKNTSIVHHLKPSRFLRCRKQEIILLDFGAKVDGYCSDMTRMVFVGTPFSHWAKAYDTIAHIQQAILDKISHILICEKTFSGAMMDTLARHMIEQAGLPPYSHGLGHGIGKEIHESPRLNRKKDAQLTPGMVVTIEPGTYSKKDYGIRIEDTVCLTEDGIECLTKTSKELLIK